MESEKSKILKTKAGAWITANSNKYDFKLTVTDVYKNFL